MSTTRHSPRGTTSCSQNWDFNADARTPTSLAWATLPASASIFAGNMFPPTPVHASTLVDSADAMGYSDLLDHRPGRLAAQSDHRRTSLVTRRPVCQDIPTSDLHSGIPVGSCQPITVPEIDAQYPTRDTSTPVTARPRASFADGLFTKPWPRRSTISELPEQARVLRSRRSPARFLAAPPSRTSRAPAPTSSRRGTTSSPTSVTSSAISSAASRTRRSRCRTRTTTSRSRGGVPDRRRALPASPGGLVVTAPLTARVH